jgi:hypothetical protein
MKVAVLVAVLANFALFFWLRWAVPAVPPLAAGLVPAPVLRHPLRLISGNAGVAHCLRLAPSANATVAGARAARLRQQGFDAHRVAESQSKARGYWVLLSGFVDVSSAHAAAAKLRQGGIKDLFVLSSSHAGQTSLSLGLFRDLDHARKRANQARALGFQPQIHERFRSTLQWTVQVPATASARAAFPATAVTPSRCQGWG